MISLLFLLRATARCAEGEDGQCLEPQDDSPGEVNCPPGSFRAKYGCETCMEEAMYCPGGFFPPALIRDSGFFFRVDGDPMDGYEIKEVFKCIYGKYCLRAWSWYVRQMLRPSGAGASALAAALLAGTLS
jgi:hypothetical protein